MTEFSDNIRKKREEQAAEFKDLAQMARLITAVNNLGTKLDTVIELLKKDQKQDDKPESAKEA